MLIGMEGRAQISCVVNALGGLEKCMVSQESPRGFGFGQAALSIAPFFKMKPLTVDGAAVAGGTFSTTIRFNLPDAPEPVTPAASTAFTPTPKALALAMRLIAAQGEKDFIDKANRNVVAHVRKSIADDPGSDDTIRKVRAAALDAFERASLTNGATYADRMAQVLAQTFSEQELEAIVAFYESAAGKAFTERRAQLFRENDRVAREAADKMVADAHRLFCVANDCPSLTLSIAPVAPAK